MGAVEDILNQIPVDEVAKKVGSNPAEVETAIRGLVPSMVQNMQTNAASPEGEASLAGALSDHVGDTANNEGQTLDLSGIDEGDGNKIAHHMFGMQEDQQIHQVAAGAGVGSDLVKKLLPIIAPIVVAYLARELTSGKYGDVLGGILGGNMQGAPAPGGAATAPEPQQQAGGGILGDILGQVLGGGHPQPAPRPQAQPQQHEDGGIMGALKDMLGGGKH